MRKLVLILAVLIGAVFKINAQSIPVGTPGLEDYYRREQLLGKVDSTFSFTIRPVFPESKLKTVNIYDPDGSLKEDNWIKPGPILFAKGLGSLQILPFAWQQQYNSNRPYGWNDGAIIPARGYQTMVSGGFYLRLGPLSIQLRPEFVYANNPDFSGFVNGHSDSEIKDYFSYTNTFIDLPERYGNGPYNKLFLGQSNIKLTVGPVAMGLSNENVWWGPGIHNALILTNNAPGFKHFTLHTTKPIKTYIGYFEGEIIGGRLDDSKIPPLLGTNLSEVYPPKLDDWRYFTGLNFNYHPKWITGLTLGLTRTFNAYEKDVHGFAGYLPFFTPYSKSSTTGGGAEGTTGDPFPRDQYTSVYIRWLFPKAQAEVYFEYGLNDNSYNFNDFIGSPDHSRAYLFGLRKMIPISGHKNQHILVGAEINQLSQTPDRIVRNAGNWYIHSQIKQGHTNLGQVLGAGTGPGGNLQTIDVSWISGLKRIGVVFERYEHNVDYQLSRFPDINGSSRKWVDFSFGVQGEWNYKNLIVNAKLQHIETLNYQWILKDYVPGQYYIPHNDVSNFHGQLGLAYRF